MRYLLALAVFVFCGSAFASIRDPRANVPKEPELSQEEVARQQALQRRQGEVGGVPERDGGTPFSGGSSYDSDAVSVVARSSDRSNARAANVITSSERRLEETARKPKRKAVVAIGALMAGLLLAVGAWAALQRYGPKPPSHLR